MHSLKNIKIVIKEKLNKLYKKDFYKYIKNIYCYCKLLILAPDGFIKY